MFEKEAKEYMHKDGTESEKLLNTIDLSLTKRQAFVLINICKQCFKDGAEFGYNKANEWHYVKDELPPVMKEYCGRSKLVLVVSKEKEMQYAQYVEKEKTWARGILAIDFEPYAWKEIELPKEIEENAR